MQLLETPTPFCDSANDIQVGGTHYREKQIQPWTYMESLMTPEEFEGFLRGNVIKYISRYPEKSGLQDLQKAQHYLAKLIEIKSKTSVK